LRQPDFSQGCKVGTNIFSPCHTPPATVSRAKKNTTPRPLDKHARQSTPLSQDTPHRQQTNTNQTPPANPNQQKAIKQHAKSPSKNLTKKTRKNTLKPSGPAQNRAFLPRPPEFYR